MGNVGDVVTANTRRRNKLATKPKPDEVLDHWPTLIEGLKFSSQEFYARVEKALAERQVPDLEISRIDWKEGGGLSPRREYLRLTRERQFFDICAAPFGTSFFVSVWFDEKPLKLGLLAWSLIIASALALLDYLIRPSFGLYRWLWWDLRVNPEQIMMLVIGLILIAAFVVVIRVGPNLDNVLIRVPLIGYVYERRYRTISFWRLDRMCMYRTAVHNAVTAVLDDICKAQGIAPLSESGRRPPMGDMQRRLLGQPR
jgi:hypothetical protein